MLDWLIVGGGLHGTHLAIRLLDAGADPSRLAILDPSRALLDQWRERTRRTGMMRLRSPGVHHLAPGAHDLFAWARSRGGRSRGSGVTPFGGVNRRPALDLFNAHALELVHSRGLDALHRRGRMTGVARLRGGGYRVETSDGDLETRRLVLAPGLPPAPLPEWAEFGRRQGWPLRSLFDVGGDDPADAALRSRDGREGRPPVVVVGGGISAAQVAIRLGCRGVPVVLLVRHAFRVHRFDSDPGWLGPRYLASFQAEVDPGRRRALVNGARHRGSMPEDEHRHLQALAHRGILEIRSGEPVGVRIGEGGGLLLRCVGKGEGPAAGWEVGKPSVQARGQAPPVESGHPPGETACRGSGEEEIPASFVLFATGLATHLPADHPVSLTGRALSLPLHGCGTPVLDPWLAWAPDLHLSGPFADLVLGPVAGNLAGARMAAERILSVGAP